MLHSEARKHVTDDQILSLLDGELSPKDRVPVIRHLEDCWRCRARRMRLEEQIRTLSEAWERQTYPSPNRIERSHKACLAEIERLAGKSRPAPLLPEFRLAPLSGRLRPAVVTGLLVLLMAAGVHWLAPLPVDEGRVRQVLAEVKSAEQELAQAPGIVHQVLRVQVRQTRPVTEELDGRLSIWTDASQARAAARWEDEAGQIQHAVWRSDHGVYWRDAADGEVLQQRPGKPVTLLLAADLARLGLEPNDIQRAFLAWLRTRDWRPVSFGEGFAAFTSVDGVRLSAAAEAVSAGGRRRLRVTAERDVDGLRTVLTLEADSQTRKPVLQTVVFETRERRVEFRLRVERAAAVPAVSVAPHIFEPPSNLFGGAEIATQPPRGNAAPGAPSDDLLDELEIAVVFALHEVRSCEGEPVEVIREDGRIRVEGIVQSARRKEELAAALSAFADDPSVVVRLITSDEAAGMAGRVPVEAATELSPPGGRPLGPVLLLRDLHEQHDGNHEELSRHAAEERITSLSHGVFSQSERVMAQAWAVRRLTQRFASLDLTAVAPPSRVLLQSVVHDHLSELEADVTRLGALLLPVLPEAEAGSLPAAPEPAADWREAGEALFARAAALHEIVSGVFAGDELPAAALGADGTASPNAAAQALASSLAGLRLAVEQTQKGISAVFANRQTAQEAPAGSARTAETRSSRP